MASASRQHHVARLQAEMECALTSGAWCRVVQLAESTLRIDPGNEIARQYLASAHERGERDLRNLMHSLDCLPVFAFMTDRLNRIRWVNRRFATTIGDPEADHLEPEQRFLHAAIAGPYRHRFPRWKQELSNCLSELQHEVEAGHLAKETLALVEATLHQVEELRHAIESPVSWDGTMLIRDDESRLTLVEERVLAVLDGSGAPTGLHVTQWFPAGDASSSPADSSPSVLDRLTPRQLEIATLFAGGMTAEEVANAAGIAWRTARDHLEEIYSRLDVHSRAELTLCLSRAGLLKQA